MLKGAKSAVMRLRERRAVSHVVVPIARFIHRGSSFLAAEIAKKVKVNGGTVRYDGLTIRFPPNVGVGTCSAVFWGDVLGFEPYTWRVLRNLTSGAQYFLDVGSNIGFYAVATRLVSPALVVDAFEPVPGIAEQNRLFHAQNGLSSTRVHGLALGDGVGRRTIYLPANRDSFDYETTGTLRADSWQARSPARTEIIGTETTLDEFLAANPGVPAGRWVVKIDVEDYEAAVFRGGHSTFRERRPFVVVEILPRAHQNRETAELIRGLSYSAYAITPLGCFRVSDESFSKERTFTDFVLIPSELSLAKSCFVPFEELRGSLA